MLNNSSFSNMQRLTRAVLTDFTGTEGFIQHKLSNPNYVNGVEREPFLAFKSFFNLVCILIWCPRSKRLTIDCLNMLFFAKLLNISFQLKS